MVCVPRRAQRSLRDVGHGHPAAPQLWMSPPRWHILGYRFAAALRPLYELNPMTTIIEGIGGRFSRLRPDLPDLAIAVTITVALLAFGYRYLQRSEATSRCHLTGAVFMSNVTVRLDQCEELSLHRGWYGSLRTEVAPGSPPARPLTAPRSLLGAAGRVVRDSAR